jgi:2-oxoglutarate dehydrogenase E2 component (dihydrolipoamide succinyltransferase)
MAVELRVPEVGESITEVQIGEWLKAEGDLARRDEIVVMIETDKVTVELPAPVTGTLQRIVVPRGARASVGDVIGLMDEAGGVATQHGTPPAVSLSAATVPTREPQPSGGITAPGAAAGATAPSPPAPAPRAVVPPAPAPPAVTPASEPAPARASAQLMPGARRALAEHGLSAMEVTPTGPGGRVLREDVLRAAEERQPRARRERPALSEAEPGARPAAPPPPEPSGGDRGEEIVAMTPMRRRIAERLVQSQQTAALLTTFNEIDMSTVVAMRREHQERFQHAYGIKLGMMSFFVKAAIEALKLVPEVNAEIRGADIAYRSYYDIGVAVGGGRGLVVPVIRNAERLSFADIERAIADFGERARTNKLRLDELQGGTFTISNGGVYGSLLSTPIVNPPQSGILGLHAIQDRAVVRDGQVVVRPMMYVALTYDHRLIDGREAVTFLKRVKECVEAPSRILLEV